MREPTARQRQAKARFWQRFDANPTLGRPEALSGPEITRLAAHQSIFKQLREDEELYNWFFDKDYAESILKSGLEIAVMSLIDICVSPICREIPAASKVKAAETLMKYGGMGQTAANQTKFKDDKIDQMTSEELERYIAEGNKDLKVIKNVKETS